MFWHCVYRGKTSCIITPSLLHVLFFYYHSNYLFQFSFSLRVPGCHVIASGPIPTILLGWSRGYHWCIEKLVIKPLFTFGPTVFTKNTHICAWNWRPVYTFCFILHYCSSSQLTNHHPGHSTKNIVIKLRCTERIFQHTALQSFCVETFTVTKVLAFKGTESPHFS